MTRVSYASASMLVARDISEIVCGDAVRLVLRLLEHALDLAADTLGDRPVQPRATGQPTLGADAVAPVLEVLELVDRLFELAEQERRGRRPIAGDPGEVPVEIGFEAGRVTAVAPAPLHAVAQRCDHPLEIRCARVGRGRRLLVGHAAECTLTRPSGADGLHGRRALRGGLQGRPRS